MLPVYMALAVFKPVPPLVSACWMALTPLVSDVGNMELLPEHVVLATSHWLELNAVMWIGLALLPAYTMAWSPLLLNPNLAPAMLPILVAGRSFLMLITVPEATPVAGAVQVRPPAHCAGELLVNLASVNWICVPIIIS